MVVGDVGKYRAPEVQAPYAALVQGMGTDFHEAVFAAPVRHHAQEAVDGYRILGGVGGLETVVADVIGYGGQQTAAVAHPREQAVEQGGYGGLAVSAGDSDQVQLTARMSEEIAGDVGRGRSGVRYPDTGESEGCNLLGGLRLAVDCGAGSGLGRFPDVCVPVALESVYGDEQTARRALSGVGGNVCDILVQAAGRLQHFYTF